MSAEAPVAAVSPKEELTEEAPGGGKSGGSPGDAVVAKLELELEAQIVANNELKDENQALRKALEEARGNNKKLQAVLNVTTKENEELVARSQSMRELRQGTESGDLEQPLRSGSESSLVSAIDNIPGPSTLGLSGRSKKTRSSRSHSRSKSQSKAHTPSSEKLRRRKPAPASEIDDFDLGIAPAAAKEEDWASLMDDLSGSHDGPSASRVISESDRGQSTPKAVERLLDAAESLTRPGEVSLGRKPVTSGKRAVFQQELADAIVDEALQVPRFLIDICNDLSSSVSDLALLTEIRRELMYLGPAEYDKLDKKDLEHTKDALDGGAVLSELDTSLETKIALLLLWFHELPQPIFSGYSRWLEWYEVGDPSFRINALSMRLHALSPEQCRTAIFALQFLRKLSADLSAPIDKTNAAILALAPSILRDDRPDQERSASFKEISAVNVAVEVCVSLINSFDEVVNPDSSSAGGDLIFSTSEGQRLIAAGTVDRLINMSADGFYLDLDPAYVGILLLTHEYFSADEEFLEQCLALVSRCDVEQPWQRMIRLRMLKNLRHWLQDHASSLASPLELATQVSSFFSDFLPVSKEEEHLVNFFESVGDLLAEVGKAKPAVVQEFTPEDRERYQFVEEDPYVIAVQLTLVDSELFTSISGAELITNRWTDPKTSPNYHGMVARFNDYSAWVSRDVLDNKTYSRNASKRGRIIAQWCRIASQCVHLGNYHAAYAIMAALKSPAIERLGKSWGKVAEPERSDLGKVLDLFDMSGNFARYKKELYGHTEAVVPWIGLWPKELVMAEEMETTHDAADVFNFGKMRVLHRIIAPMLALQQKAFRQRVKLPLRNWLESIRAEACEKPLDDKTMFTMSKSLEKSSK